MRLRSQPVSTTSWIESFDPHRPRPSRRRGFGHGPPRLLSTRTLLVAQAKADGAPTGAHWAWPRRVRVDFTGTLVHGLAAADPAVHVQGAIFSGPRQAQALVSSLRKVVRSALEQRRARALRVSGEVAPALLI